MLLFFFSRHWGEEYKMSLKLRMEQNGFYCWGNQKINESAQICHFCNSKTKSMLKKPLDLANICVFMVASCQWLLLFVLMQWIFVVCIWVPFLSVLLASCGQMWSVLQCAVSKGISTSLLLRESTWLWFVVNYQGI